MLHICSALRNQFYYKVSMNTLCNYYSSIITPLSINSEFIELKFKNIISIQLNFEKQWVAKFFLNFYLLLNQLNFLYQNMLKIVFQSSLHGFFSHFNTHPYNLYNNGRHFKIHNTGRWDTTKWLKEKNHNLLFILIKCTFQMKENYVQTARKIEFTSDFKM